MRLRKTPMMLMLEERYGQDIRTILANAYTQHGTLERAAKSLDMPMPTFHAWLQRLGIEIRKEAVVS